jgi:alanyl-tRNA synthetase
MDNRTKESTALTREYFINYFRKNGHKYLKPTPVFNPADPTLFFVNAGMNQLKDVFLGKKSFDEKYSMLTNSQLCVRTGGKHNDFDDVGKDSYHLTSFEMLGTWSLNAYGKEQAIKLAYDFLVNHCHLNPEQLYVTYFEGTAEIPADAATKEIWVKYVPESKIVPGNFKDNFWMMAETGPCGVSTEIHYDLVGGRDASGLVNKDDPTVIEIWNNVFMQYNKTETEFEMLDNMWIDTGLGLSRLCMILQNKKTLYQTDIFRHLIGFVQALSGADFFTDQYNGNKLDEAYRIFADHIGTLVMCLFDGVKFGMHGREFILRKVMRRLLINYYLHLNEMKVEYVMCSPIIKSLISHILCYHGKKQHDADALQKLLVDEEKLFVGIIQHAEKKYKSAFKRFKDEQKAIEFVVSSEGIPREILEHQDKLVFEIAN